MLLSCLALAGCSQNSGERGAGAGGAVPRLGFEQSEYVLEPQSWGAHVETEVKFLNAIDREMVVYDLRFGCDCASADREPIRSVAARATVVVPVRIEVGPKPGRKDVSILLKSSEGDFETRVSMEVLPTFTFDPDPVVFSGVDLGSDAPHTLEVAFTSALGAHLTGVETECPWLKAEVRDSKIVLSLDKGRMRFGRQSAALWVRTDDPRMPERVLPVEASAVMGLRPAVAHILLRGDQPKDVRFTSDTDFAIQTCSCADPAVTVTKLDDQSIRIRKTSSATFRSIAVVVTDNHGRRAQVLVSAF
jgi:hypothetical protein